MKTFLKGFCISLLCLSLLGLAWFLVLQPGLTNGEAQALKDEYTVQPFPEPKAPGRNRLGMNKPARNRSRKPW